MVIVCVDFVLLLGMVRDQAGELNVQGQKSDPRMVEAGDLLYHMFAAEPMMDESTLTQAEKDELNSYKFVVSDHLGEDDSAVDSEDDKNISSDDAWEEERIKKRPGKDDCNMHEGKGGGISFDEVGLHKCPKVKTIDAVSAKTDSKKSEPSKKNKGKKIDLRHLDTKGAAAAKKFDTKVIKAKAVDAKRVVKKNDGTKTQSKKLDNRKKDVVNEREVNKAESKQAGAKRSRSVSDVLEEAPIHDVKKTGNETSEARQNYETV